MAFKNLEPGEYAAKVDSWGVREVEELDGALLATVTFKLETGDLATWESFFMKKNGEYNQYTLKAIKACGFSGDKLELFVDDDALDREKDLSITLERDENDYLRVKWVNDPSANFKQVMESKDAVKKLRGLKLDGVLMKMKRETPEKTKKYSRKVKNHAPGAPDIDHEEELPF